MPFVINGVGTWYYGKKRIHTIRETCEFCNRVSDLSSYDTTLFFVVGFIPLIPLQRLRILRSCGVCQKHRLISLKKWEAAKSADSAELLEALQADPDNRETVMKAIRFSMAYQDEPLFTNTVEALAAAKTDDAEIQTLLGHGYSYFSRWPEAGQAFEAALRVEDTEDARESLAWALLKQGRPDDARPWLQHILDNKKRDAAGTVYYLVKAYQAQGRHDDALEVMDERDAAFPDWVGIKEYREQRKTSAKYRGTGKKVASALLADGKAGYRDGGRAANWPRWVAAAVVVGALAVYLGSAVWIGQNRKVYFVNGTNKPYSVTVQGNRHMLPTRTVVPIRVAEGDIEVAFDDKPGLEPVRGQIDTSFWGRPFAGHTFVVNPDQSAIIVEEESVYSKNNPRMGNAPTVHFGAGFYAMPGVDYEFEEFPPTLQVKGSGDVTKSRVALINTLAPETRLIMAQELTPDRQLALCRKLLLLDPGETMFLYWLSALLPPEEAITFVEPRLADRPILVEWHRVYQTLMERAHPETDLRPKYRQLVAETNSHAEALYLLGRSDPDLAESEKLYRQAAAAKPASGFACQGLGYRAMSEGKFPEAVEWLEKALTLPVDRTVARMYYHDALLAKGDDDSLLSALQQDANVPGRRFSSQTQMLRVHAIRGDKPRAAQTIADIVRECPPQEQTRVRQSIEALVSCSQNDVAGYLKASKNNPTFESAFLSGRPAQAAELAKDGPSPAGLHQGLLWLEADRAGRKEAAATHFAALLDELKKANREERVFGEMLAGRQPATAAERIPLDPSAKRVLLAVLARKQPARAAELLTLAKKLDFHRDAISLCLATYLL